jgi:hypothetical protein
MGCGTFWNPDRAGGGIHRRCQFNDVYENTECLASLCALYQELAADVMPSYVLSLSRRILKIVQQFGPRGVHPSTKLRANGE